MLFNSLEFFIFLPIVFVLYWFVTNKKLKFQNILLLVASYVFYGWWDWRFLSLIVISSFIDYYIGLGLEKSASNQRRKYLLVTSVCVNLGFLGFFKYYNFFLDSFVDAFTFFGNPPDVNRLNIILPVGISFYTFQTLSYSIDVYRRKLKPTNDMISFFAFVSFFPQLVAGPIERASNLLPQFYKKREFDYDKSVDGLQQILWGLFKKVVIADSCAIYVNLIFNNSADYSGSTLLLGAVLFAFQIYGDFSGYSDIAIGTARLFGFNLMKNFAFPYFSRDIGEFWRRWHISLSTWFRDYLYIPLGGSRGGNAMRIRNTFVIFIVSGFWHGANWTFIFWGLLNALYFLPLLLLNKNRQNLGSIAENRLLPSFREGSNIIFTFILTTIAWIFFRAESLTHAFQYFTGIFDKSLFFLPKNLPFLTIVMVIIFLIAEWIGREEEYALAKIRVLNSKFLKWSVFYVLIFCIFYFHESDRSFIYFQF